MQLTTTFPIPEARVKINHQSGIYAIGSCFSTVIGDKLVERKFPVLNNTFGTLFNPISIARVMEDALLEMPIDKNLIVVRDGLFLYYGMHSDVVAYSQDSLERLILKKQQQTRKVLEQASHVLITLGTAWVYEFGNGSEVVANCHKQPAHLFEKRLLHPDEIQKAFTSFLNLLVEINPNVQVIFTVSPVRHTKDGIPQNQLSKSVLRLAANDLEETYDFVHYFPSFEIMMDELRDYRFYKDDLIHPSHQAESYIWERFKQTWIDKRSFDLIEEFEAIKRDLMHKPFNPDSPAHLKFLDNLQKKLERYSRDFDFSKEQDMLRKQLQYRGK
ncbi:GSCFA domain-containing protein [Mongoliitalea daihaiensis]|uniref:GSCFA domain-containing protein n=1 Tax=Mongoliitalea daihaiensis TaxID=2782006 RepID=UPI001F1C5FF1|nr:GSCFA domain-containing protein [Mongoliitalea daihaiensis]UJP64567.1 GSCFA domain-containing protein [Mongoliitalea daihaiensis]